MNNLAGNPHMNFTYTGGHSGYICPKCGQRIGNWQVHDCFNHSICPDCGAIVGQYQVHQCSGYKPYTPPFAPTIPITGYYCNECKTFVVDGFSHLCTRKPKPLGISKPYTCPKCGGEKKVNWKKCKPCDGTGIVWG
jgi:hypothetical protein